MNASHSMDSLFSRCSRSLQTTAHLMEETRRRYDARYGISTQPGRFLEYLQAMRQEETEAALRMVGCLDAEISVGAWRDASADEPARLPFAEEAKVTAEARVWISFRIALEAIEACPSEELSGVLWSAWKACVAAMEQLSAAEPRYRDPVCESLKDALEHLQDAKDGERQLDFYANL